MFTLKFWKAAAERMVRGAAVSVAAVYFGGDVVFDSLNVNTWTEAGGIAITGAVGSLVLSLAGQAFTGSGPSFNSTETTEG